MTHAYAPPLTAEEEMLLLSRHVYGHIHSVQAFGVPPGEETITDVACLGMRQRSLPHLGAPFPGSTVCLLRPGSE